MRNWVFVLLLLGGPAAAEWTRVAGGEASNTYVDLTTIRKQANVVDMSVLFDYKTAQNWSDYLLYFSTKTQKEFDCDARKYHTLNSMLHFEHMGEGESIYTIPGGASWQPVPADSIDAVLWKFACEQ
jgi:hypothetical protein